MNYFLCNRLRLYTHLTKLGFVPYEVIPDPIDYKKKNWIYIRNQALSNALEEYFEDLRNRNIYPIKKQ